MMVIDISIFSLIILLLVSPLQSNPNEGSIEWWCDQTPYPEPCKYHTTTHSIPSTLVLPKSDFLVISEKITINESLSILNYANSLVPKIVDNVEKSVLIECAQFYQRTINQLNQALNTALNPTPSDIQTWLSAALTNLRTCQSDFVDRNISQNSYPLINFNNITQLVSNCLATNFNFTKDQHAAKIEKYPAWFRGDDQRLIFKVKPSIAADTVVAQDGSGNFKSVTEALQASLRRTDFNKRFTIYVKGGVYNEHIEVTDQMKNVLLVGDGADITVITGNTRAHDVPTLIQSSTAMIYGEGFIAKDMTFENTAGVDQGQAVALTSLSDHSVFYRCNFKGYQDTLFAHSNRQFYKDCKIKGTVDFIFGNAVAVFQDCNIYVRKPRPGGGLVITAQKRETELENTGFTLQKCNIKADEPLGSTSAFLGRPWGTHSRTVYMQSYLGLFVHPEGWMKWDNGTSINTLYYGEYDNNGRGSDTKMRVQWPGYHIIRDIETANMFTVQTMIDGQTWLPATGVPFVPGLCGNNPKYC